MAAMTTSESMFTDNTSLMYDNSTITFGTTSKYDELLVHFEGLFIHPHYYQYLEYVLNLPDIYFYLLGIYIAIVGMIGVFGNALVIYIFSTTKNLQTPPNLFIINLAISDLGFSAINGFPLMTISSFMKRWYFGETTCTVYAMLGGLFGFNSIATLAFISMDRYYVIAYPFDAMRKCTKKRALMQIVIVWIWAILLSFPPLFGFGRYIAEGVMVECSFDYISRDWPNYIFNYLMLVFGFFFPVFIIAICYINIYRAVSSQAAQMRQKTEKLSGESKKTEKEKQQNIQLAKIAAITISLFIVSWVPYTIFAVAGINGYVFMVTPTTTQIPVLFAKASAIWNPMLYALSHPRFRAVLEEKFPYLLFCQGNNIDKGDDEKSDNTQVTKAGGGKLRRTDSTDSECSEISDSVAETSGRISHAPSGKRPQRPRPQVASGPAPVKHPARMAEEHQARIAEQTDSYGQEEYTAHHNQRATPSPNMAAGPGGDVHPRAMTRAANAIFSHLVTAYEGMRVLTTSGDGSGANKVEHAFANPAFEGDRPAMMPMSQHGGYYGMQPPHHPGLMPPYADMRRHSNPLPNDVYAIPMNGYGMGGSFPGYYGPQPPMLHVENEQVPAISGSAQKLTTANSRPLQPNQMVQSPHPSRIMISPQHRQPSPHRPPPPQRPSPPQQLSMRPQHPPQPTPVMAQQNQQPKLPLQVSNLPEDQANVYTPIPIEAPNNCVNNDSKPVQNPNQDIAKLENNDNRSSDTIQQVNNIPEDIAKIENNDNKSSVTMKQVNNIPEDTNEKVDEVKANEETNDTKEETKEENKVSNDEDLPPPPDELLDENEDEEDSGEYNIASANEGEININNNSNAATTSVGDITNSNGTNSAEVSNQENNKESSSADENNSPSSRSNNTSDNATVDNKDADNQDNGAGNADNTSTGKDAAKNKSIKSTDLASSDGTDNKVDETNQGIELKEQSNNGGAFRGKQCSVKYDDGYV